MTPRCLFFSSLFDFVMHAVLFSNAFVLWFHALSSPLFCVNVLVKISVNYLCYSFYVYVLWAQIWVPILILEGKAGHLFDSLYLLVLFSPLGKE